MKRYTRLIFSVLSFYACVPSNGQTQTERAVSQDQAPVQQIAPVEEGVSATSYYKIQQQAWQGQLSMDQKDPNAWLNYYKAYRFSNYSETSKAIDPAAQVVLDEIVNEMNSNVPNTFESNYATYWNSSEKIKNRDKLEAAHKSDPERSEIYDDLIGLYEMTGDDASRKVFSTQLNASGVIPDQIMTYNTNVLNSVESGAVLITNGFDDTYPAFIQQDVNNHRADVSIVQLDLLQEKQYRDKVSQELNVAPIASNDRATIVRSLTNSSKPIYFGLTLPPEIILEHQDKLYMTGLALKFSEKSIDNASQLKQNWSRMELDYLQKWKPTGDTRQDGLIKNYMLPLAVLEDIYASEGDEKQANELGRTLDRIAGDAGKKNELKKARAIHTY